MANSIAVSSGDSKVAALIIVPCETLPGGAGCVPKGLGGKEDAGRHAAKH